MGCVKNISYDKFPKQSDSYKPFGLGSRVEVCYNYDTSKCHYGTIVRDDTEEPFETIIRLDNGRYVRSSECQYSMVNQNNFLINDFARPEIKSFEQNPYFQKYVDELVNYIEILENLLQKSYDKCDIIKNISIDKITGEIKEHLFDLQKNVMIEACEKTFQIIDSLAEKVRNEIIGKAVVTDREKFIYLLNSLKVPFIEWKNSDITFSVPRISLETGDSSATINGVIVSLVFDKNGKLKYFSKYKE